MRSEKKAINHPKTLLKLPLKAQPIRNIILIDIRFQSIRITGKYIKIYLLLNKNEDIDYEHAKIKYFIAIVLYNLNNNKII